MAKKEDMLNKLKAKYEEQLIVNQGKNVENREEIKIEFEKR
jgi:hypothetical protein